MQSGLQNSCRSRGRMASGLVPDSNRLKNQVAECAVKQLIAVFFELLPNLAFLAGQRYCQVLYDYHARPQGATAGPNLQFRPFGIDR